MMAELWFATCCIVYTPLYRLLISLGSFSTRKIKVDGQSTNHHIGGPLVHIGYFSIKNLCCWVISAQQQVPTYLQGTGPSKNIPLLNIWRSSKWIERKTLNIYHERQINSWNNTVRWNQQHIRGVRLRAPGVSREKHGEYDLIKIDSARKKS